MKSCKKCLKIKDISQFHKHQTNLDGLSNQCKSCKADYSRKYNMRSKFKLSHEEYTEMYRIQRGKCGICGIHRNKLDKNLAVDHDHKTNGIRGLLCTSCNTALGSFKDSKRRLIRAVAYLQKDYYK